MKTLEELDEVTLVVALLLFFRDFESSLNISLLQERTTRSSSLSFSYNLGLASPTFDRHTTLFDLTPDRNACNDTRKHVPPCVLSVKVV